VEVCVVFLCLVLKSVAKQSRCHFVGLLASQYHVQLMWMFF